MIPFCRPLEYGNRIIRWYTGNEVIAYDYENFDAAGFTDYTGKTVEIYWPYNNGNLPTQGLDSINLNSGAIGSKQVSPSYLGGDWCMDMNVKYTQIGASHVEVLPFYPLMNDSNGSGSPTIMEIQGNPTTKYLTRFQGTSWQDIPYYYPEIRTEIFSHFALQYHYDEKKLYTFVNGVMVCSATITYTTPTATIYNAAIWGNYGHRSGSFCAIDRYRVRTGRYFDVNGFNTGDIYPGTKLN